MRLGRIDVSNPRVWIVVGITVAGVVVLAEATRRRRRRGILSEDSKPVESFGAFVERFELPPSPQPPPPAARLALAGLTFAVSDKYSFCVFDRHLVFDGRRFGFLIANDFRGFLVL